MTDFRILITGSRDWTDRDAIADVLRREILGEPRGAVLVHGGARGADTIAGEIATGWGMQIEVHRANWHAHGAAAGPKRNRLMVELGATVCLAFPIGESKGTRGCIALAEKAGIPVVVTEGAQT